MFKQGIRTQVLALLALGLVGCHRPVLEVSDTQVVPELTFVGLYQSQYAKQTEILSLDDTRQQLLLSQSQGYVERLSLADPAQPQWQATLALDLAPDEVLTSIAMHPQQPWFAAAIKSTQPFVPGRVELWSLEGERLASFEAGYGPDHVLVAPDGGSLLVANEGELWQRQGDSLLSEPGSLTLVRLATPLAHSEVLPISLPEVQAVGMLQRGDRRFIERTVDWNQDGQISEQADFDGDGLVGGKLDLGQYQGVAIKANEQKGEEAILIPLTANTAEQLEPEYSAFSPDSLWAWVSLQENNGLAKVDITTAQVVEYIGLGSTTHLADIQDDGGARLTHQLTALREPDAIAVLPGGQWLVTADEGDTEPKASRVLSGHPAGGGRTLSVVDLQSGQVVGDTGAQLDQAMIELRAYPDGRSDNKGSEPETVVVFAWQGRPYVAVALERANALALVDVSVPRAPQVVAAAAIAEGLGNYAPEGVAYWRRGDVVYLYTANEKAGSVAVFRLSRRP